MNAIKHSSREFPVIRPAPAPVIPLSIICVHFSNEFYHNITRSECVGSSLNEFIVIDNRLDFNFRTLGEAMLRGVERANNELLAFVHEDVYLLPDWQGRFEASLRELERQDSKWFCLGSVGWDDQGNFVGHASSPHGYRNGMDGRPFAPVHRLDEQILVIRKADAVSIDQKLPSIHNIGRDLCNTSRSRGLLSYTIDAPPIHKYADADGHLITSTAGSKKIADRKSYTYKADRACSDEYFARKWRVPGMKKIRISSKLAQLRTIEEPVILLGRGGAGTRLLSEVARSAGLFVGNKVNSAGDCLDMVMAIYQGVIRKYKCPSRWQRQLIVPHLQAAAAEMLELSGWPEKWAFKLPESLLLLPELSAAFPRARYAVLHRNPAEIVLRRSHMTARPDNHIGRVVLKATYKAQGLDVDTLLSEPEVIRMARTTVYQLELLERFRKTQDPGDWIELSFERLIIEPRSELSRFASFLSLPVLEESITKVVDSQRAANPGYSFPPEVLDKVLDILAPVCPDGKQLQVRPSRWWRRPQRLIGGLPSLRSRS